MDISDAISSQVKEEVNRQVAAAFAKLSSTIRDMATEIRTSGNSGNPAAASTGRRPGRPPGSGKKVTPITQQQQEESEASVGPVEPAEPVEASDIPEAS